MTTRTFAAICAVGLMLSMPGVAGAADKEQLQMMADLRILQEQSQQLQNLIAALNESVRAVNQRLDEQADADRKAAADQKLVINGVSDDLRILREKVDDNNVRVGSLGQEIDALRQSVASLYVPPPAPPLTADGTAPDGTVPDGTAPPADPSAAPPPAPTGAAAVGASPQKLLDGAMADYYAGQYDLAVLGLDSYIKTFPQSPQADYAQFHIGSSYYQQANYEKAVEAYDAMIKTYPQSSFVPDAYVRLGVAYKNLKQADKAREAFDYVIKNYPDTVAATMAQQNLSTQKP
jgi:tol-pal system protein YbgF